MSVDPLGPHENPNARDYPDGPGRHASDRRGPVLHEKPELIQAWTEQVPRAVKICRAAEMLAWYLHKYAQGRDQALKAYVLVDAFADTRFHEYMKNKNHVTKLVEKLRIRRLPVGSSTSYVNGGYFWCLEDTDDLERSMVQYTRMATKIIHTAERLKASPIYDLTGYLNKGGWTPLGLCASCKAVILEFPILQSMINGEPCPHCHKRWGILTAGDE